MTGREKGVATVPCPTCGSDLPVADQRDDGATVGQSCPTCYPRTSTEQASAPAPVNRERGVPQDETPVEPKEGDDD